MNPKDRVKKGSSGQAVDLVIDDGGVTDPAGQEYERKQVEVLRLAAEARKLLATERVAERSAPAPLTNPKATATKAAALEEQLVRLADQIGVAKVNKETAEKAETLAAKQREVDAATLRAEQARLEAEASRVQQELQQLEAIALADAVAQEQATGRRPELDDAPTWRATLAADLEPMQTAAVGAVVKLRELLAEKGPVLDRIATLQPDETMPPELWHQYVGIASKAKTIRAELALSIQHTQAVLDKVAKWSPAYWTEDVGRYCHLLQRELERVSGVVVRPRAFRDTRAGMKATGVAPAVPAVVAGYAQQITDLLTSYREIQQRADAAKGAPREVVIRLEPSRYWEGRRRQKVDDALREKPEPAEPGVLASLGIDTNTPPSV